jgi:hypothetical protein
MTFFSCDDLMVTSKSYMDRAGAKTGKTCASLFK